MENENKLEEIRSIVDKLPKGNLRRYTPEISELIKQYTRAKLSKGTNRSEIAKDLGTCVATLNRITGYKKSTKASKKFRRVKIDEPKESGGKICLPGGISIVGLALDELVVVARGLSK
jgi:hypothetical protein